MRRRFEPSGVHGHLAQLAERSTLNRSDPGSWPGVPTTFMSAWRNRQTHHLERVTPWRAGSNPAADTNGSVTHRVRRLDCLSSETGSSPVQGANSECGV